MEEIWKDIKGYKGLYQVSNLGRVKSLEKINKTSKFYNSSGYYRKERILNQYERVKTKNNNNYLVVTLYGGEKYKKMFLAHRLVAETFIPNPNNYLEVNHIDGNKQNNNVTNLEWCSRKQNAIHSIKNGLQKTLSVNQYDLNGNYIKTYFNSYQAEIETKIFHISDCCNKKRKTAGGYIWKYVPSKNY